MENKCLLIFPIQKNLLYYSMNKAYKKAIEVIESCNNTQQIYSAFNYIWNFERLFYENKTCKDLTKKLRSRCARKRKSLENI